MSAITVLRLERSTAVGIFSHLGLYTADDWDNAKLAEKLVDVGDLVEDDADPPDDGVIKEGLEQVLAAVEAGGEISVGDDLVGEAEEPAAETEQPAESEAAEEPTIAETEELSGTDLPDGGQDAEPESENGEPPKALKNKRGRKKKKNKDKPADGETEATAPAKKDPVEKDKFGCRVDSITSRVALCLTNEPQSMAELVKAAGGDSKDRQYNLMKKLIEKGVVTRTDDKKFYLVTDAK